MKLFELFAELSLDSSNFDRGIRGASAAGESFAHKLGGGVKSTTIALGNLMSQAVTKGAALLKQFASIGLGYNRQMETYNMNFRTLLGGSSEAASAMVEELRSMAAATPFAMSDLAGATQTLLSFGVESESVVSTLQMLGDISLGNAQNMSSLALVFGQVSSAGKLMGQDLMQFINAGFNPLLTISEKTGLSMTELKDFMSSGKMSSAMRREVRKAQREVAQMGDQASDAAKMLAQMGEDGVISAELLAQVFSIETSPGGRFYQAMASASQTTEGMLSTLEDNANTLLGNILQPTAKFISEKILPAAIKMTDRLNAAYDEGGLAGLWAEAQEIGSELMSTLGQSAVDAGANLLANLYTSLTGDTTSAEAVKTYLGGLWTDAQTAVSDFVGAGSAVLSTIYTVLTGQTATAENVKTTLSQLFEAGSVAATGLLSTSSTLLSGIHSALLNEQGEATSISELLNGLFSTAEDTAESLVQTAGQLIPRIYEILTGDTATAQKIQNFLTELFAPKKEEEDAFVSKLDAATEEFLASPTWEGFLEKRKQLDNALESRTVLAEAIKNSGSTWVDYLRDIPFGLGGVAASGTKSMQTGWALIAAQAAAEKSNSPMSHNEWVRNYARGAIYSNMSKNIPGEHLLDWAGRLLTGRSGANKMDWGSIYSEWFAEAGKTVGNVLEYYAPGVFVGEARARRKRAVEGYDETDRNDFGEFTGTLSAVLDEKLSALADRIEHITLKVTIDGEQITNTINKTNFRKTNTARYTKY